MQLDIKCFKKDIGRITVGYKEPILWNAIANNLKERNNTQDFKSNIKLHIDFIKRFSFKPETCIFWNQELWTFNYQPNLTWHFNYYIYCSIYL